MTSVRIADKGEYKKAQTAEDLLTDTPVVPKEAGKGWKGPKGSINTRGRPKEEDRVNIDKLTNGDLKQRELIGLLRKLKPHVAGAIITAVKVMENAETSDQNKLKASGMILQQFHRMVLDVYGTPGTEEEKGEEIQKKSAPVFSLRMLPQEEEVEPEVQDGPTYEEDSDKVD